MKFLQFIDMVKNEIRNAILHLVAGAPGGASEGQIWYDTNNNSPYVQNDSEAVPLDARLRTGIPTSNLATNPLARANHTGTQTASTVSDFDTQVRTNRLDQMANPTASVSLNSQKITNLADPTTSNDAANKNYVDAQVQASQAGLDAKASCRVATTANITLSGEQTIDGVSVVAGDRVLAKDQSTGSQNGIYVCASGAWSRSSDCDSTNDYTPQAFTFIEEGSTNGGSQWKVSTTGAITVGTTAVTWVQFGAASVYTADANGGLQVSGNAFSVKLPASSGLVKDSSGLYVDSAIVVKKFSQDVGDGSSTSITVTHNLNTRDVVVSVRNNSSPYDVQLCDVEAATVNTVTLKFGTAPTTNQLRCTVHG